MTLDERSGSLTALITAFARAYHAENAPTPVLNDHLARKLFSEAEWQGISAHLTAAIQFFDPAFAATNPDPDAALAAVMKAQSAPITLSRGRYTEDRLDEAIAAGTRQYVILGAGFDTFAFRRPDLAPKLRVFEVDHPVTQAAKRSRLTDLGWAMPANLRFIPVDFANDDLAQSLRQSDYDPSAPALFSWLGVTYYLPREAIFATLRAIADVAAAGSSIVFDYLDVAAFDPRRAGERVQKMITITGRAGEPMQSGFDPALLPGELAACGFRLSENLAPEAIEERYFARRTDGYHAFEQIRFARAIVTSKASTDER